jgi:hypothetical protein
MEQMNQPAKTRLSSQLTFLRLLSLGLVIAVFYQVVNSNADTDFKTGLEYKISLVPVLSFFIYFLTLRTIHYTSSTLFLKNIFQQEEVVPFENIRSIRVQVFVKGIGYKIRYMNAKGSTSAAMLYGRSYKAIDIFKTQVKMINPAVETTFDII